MIESRGSTPSLNICPCQAKSASARHEPPGLSTLQKKPPQKCLSYAPHARRSAPSIPRRPSPAACFCGSPFSEPLGVDKRSEMWDTFLVGLRAVCSARKTMGAGWVSSVPMVGSGSSTYKTPRSQAGLCVNTGRHASRRSDRGVLQEPRRSACHFLGGWCIILSNSKREI